MYCPECGAENGVSALHCAECRAPLGRSGLSAVPLERVATSSRRRPRRAAGAPVLGKATALLLIAALVAAELWWVYLDGFASTRPVVASLVGGTPREFPVATSTPLPATQSPSLPVTPSPSLSISPSPSATARPSPSPTLPATPTATSTAIPSPTTTPTATRTLVPTPSPPVSASPSPRVSASPSPSPSPSLALDQTVTGIFQGLPTGSSALFGNLTAPGNAELNAAAQVPSASTIKLPLMVEVLRQAGQGRISLDQRHTITGDVVVGGTGILQSQVGRALTTRELLETTIGYSDNVGANLLLDVVGMESVNATMGQLGFPSTRFARRMMDLEAQRRGLENVTSARDVAEMLRRIYQGQLISPSASAEMMRILRLRGQQTSPALDTLGRRLIPRPDIAHISGNLAGVHNDAGIIQSGDRAYLLAIFTHDQRDDAAAEEAIAEASARVFQLVSDSDNKGQ